MTTVIRCDKAKGTDFCGLGDYQYIIRSDLGCFVKARQVLAAGNDPVTIHPLHPNCAWGDHYVATPHHFYIIKGKECRKVTDLCTGADPITFSLNAECQDGVFYMAKDSKKFFIIKKSNNDCFPYECKLVEDLKNGHASNEQMLDKYRTPDAERGVDLGSRYHWATTGYVYFLKPITTWSLEYHRTKDLFKDAEKCNDYPVYPPITAFLPGGLAVIMGPTFDRWEQLLSIPGSNATNKVDNLTIKRKHGYKKPTVNPVQHKWNTSQSERSTGFTTEDIFKAALKRTFYFPAEYGGLAVDATKEDWSDVTEVEEVITPPGQHVCVWQYVLGIGDHVVLYTKHVKMTDNDSEPQNAEEHRKRMLVPLPRTQFSEEDKCFVTLQLQHESNKPSKNCIN